MKVKPYFMIHKPHVHSNEPFHKPHPHLFPSLHPKIHFHLTYTIHMKSMLNLKTTIPISFPTPHILVKLPIHHPKHPPLIKHPLLPYLHPHPYISQPPRVSPSPPTNTHAIPMLNDQSSITTALHHHHLPPNIKSSLKSSKKLKS